MEINHFDITLAILYIENADLWKDLHIRLNENIRDLKKTLGSQDESKKSPSPNPIPIRKLISKSVSPVSLPANYFASRYNLPTRYYDKCAGCGHAIGILNDVLPIQCAGCNKSITMVHAHPSRQPRLLAPVPKFSTPPHLRNKEGLILKFNKDCEFVCYYNNIEEASKKEGTALGCILGAISKQRTFGKHFWFESGVSVLKTSTGEVKTIGNF
jgi:hypothetical protein